MIGPVSARSIICALPRVHSVPKSRGSLLLPSLPYRSKSRKVTATKKLCSSATDVIAVVIREGEERLTLDENSAAKVVKVVKMVDVEVVRVSKQERQDLTTPASLLHKKTPTTLPAAAPIDSKQ